MCCSPSRRPPAAIITNIPNRTRRTWRAGLKRGIRLGAVLSCLLPYPGTVKSSEPGARNGSTAHEEEVRAGASAAAAELEETARQVRAALLSAASLGASIEEKIEAIKRTYPQRTTRPIEADKVLFELEQLRQQHTAEESERRAELAALESEIATRARALAEKTKAQWPDVTLEARPQPAAAPVASTAELKLAKLDAQLLETVGRFDERLVTLRTEIYQSQQRMEDYRTRLRDARKKGDDRADALYERMLVIHQSMGGPGRDRNLFGFSPPTPPPGYEERRKAREAGRIQHPSGRPRLQTSTTPGQPTPGPRRARKDDFLEGLRERAANTTDPEEKARLEKAIAEYEGRAGH